ncbi:transposable element Tcb2 transposase [Trichonephila clavipes]|nr:transposable element Tcb2 transposase [Trichonephila clavipes]
MVLPKQKMVFVMESYGLKIHEKNVLGFSLTIITPDRLDKPPLARRPSKGAIHRRVASLRCITSHMILCVAELLERSKKSEKITDVAREFDIAHSVVSRLWKSFKTTGMCSRWHGGGRVRSTTPAKDDISSYQQKGTGAPQLSRQHRTVRLQWCREHLNWTEQDGACVLFSDENRFSLSSDCRRQLIWRESGTAYRPENIQEKDRYPTCRIMVWAGIMINGRTRLHVVANGSMTGQRYIDEVLLPHVRLFRGAVGDKFVFMDDNATCHRTLAVQDCLDSEGIQRLVWPARSLDLNPIENVWDALGRQVAGRNYPPTNKNTLIRALTDEWDTLPQQLLDNVVQSMFHRFPISDVARYLKTLVLKEKWALSWLGFIKRRFVEWAQNEIAVVPDFHKPILFRDEAHFWLNGFVNKQNCRIWSEADPQVYVETPLHPEKLTVLCALWAGGIIGPYFFRNDEGHNVIVNGDRYRAMITNFFIPELINHDVQELWCQQDGATCHTARATIDLLEDTFGDRLISRLGPVNWPPRSCDLTPLDYFLWGYVKSLVYADKPQTLDHLEDNIRRVIADIRPQILEKVIENWTSRLNCIGASRGSNMPEIIFKM